MTDIVKSFIEAHLGKRRDNYIVPGLISNQLNLNMVRVFRNTRKQEFFITPHNHRFDLLCFVVQGYVTNTLYERIPYEQAATLAKQAQRQLLGEYIECEYAKNLGALPAGTAGMFIRSNMAYDRGQWYSMKAEQYHSIEFSPDAIVLFLEGENVNQVNKVLLPVGSDGNVCDTAVTLPWMFKES